MSAFSGMMNSIWEKLHYAYSQNNIQHILTCKSIMNPKCYILVLVFCQPGLRRGGTTVSRDRSLIVIFADTATYLPLKIHGVMWHFPASAEATQSEDPQRLVASCTYHSLYLKKKNRTRANTYCSSDLQREVVM